MSRKYTNAGHIITVFYHVPTPDRDEAIAEVEAIVAKSNECQDLAIYDRGWYYGFAEVRGTEEVNFDFDEEGNIIGHNK